MLVVLLVILGGILSWYSYHPSIIQKEPKSTSSTIPASATPHPEESSNNSQIVNMRPRCTNDQYGYSFIIPGGFQAFTKGDGGFVKTDCSKVAYVVTSFTNDIDFSNPAETAVALMVYTRQNQTPAYWEGITSMSTYISKRLSTWKQVSDTRVPTNFFLFRSPDQKIFSLVTYNNGAVYEFTVQNESGLEILLGNIMPTFQFLR